MRFAVSFRGPREAGVESALRAGAGDPGDLVVEPRDGFTLHRVTVDAVDEAEAIALVLAALWPNASFDDFAAERVAE